jgi:hypothetical protein
VLVGAHVQLVAYILDNLKVRAGIHHAAWYPTEDTPMSSERIGRSEKS